MRKNNFNSRKLLFHHDETFVSPRWKFIFTTMEIYFHRDGNLFSRSENSIKTASKLITLLAALLIMSASCVEDTLIVNTEAPAGEYGMLSLSLNRSVGVGTAVSTRAVNVTDLHDLHILVYNSAGNLIEQRYFATILSGNKYEFPVPVGNGYTVYGIANTNDETAFDEDNAGTTAELEALTTGITSWNALDADTYMLMTGKVSSVNVLDKVEHNPCALTLTRIASKVTIKVTVDEPNLTISDYQVFGLPAKTYLIEQPLPVVDYDEGENDTNTSRATGDAATAAADFLSTPKTETTTGFSVSFYMFENRAGVATGVTSGEKNKGTSAGTFTTNAARIVIHGAKTVSGWDAITWTVYLGGNNFNNYNVKRNGTYSYNISLKRASYADTRISFHVSSLFAYSNIYWDGTKLTFARTEDEAANNVKYYNGIYFRWGSLVGLGVPNTYGRNTRPDVKDNLGEGYAYSYTPTGGGAYRRDNTYTVPFTTIGTSPACLWDISLTNTGQMVAGCTDNYITATYPTPDLTNNVGDVCKYISNGDYRLPTSFDFDENPTSYIESWINTHWSYQTGTYTTNVNGTGVSTMCAIYDGKYYFPIVGYLSDTGTLYHFGDYGDYWTSSVVTGNNRALRLGINNHTYESLPPYDETQNKVEIGCRYDELRWLFLSVRCIKNT